MKSAKLIPLLLAMTVLLCGCNMNKNVTSRIASTAQPGLTLPVAEASESLRTSNTSTLWFRYGSEPYLAQESRTISASPSESYETALLQALVAGPAPTSHALGSLFPAGTRVLLTSHSGRILFVTLSSEILNRYPDEPEDWENDAYWQIEVPLRRKLCMQSLIATVTENCDADSVQILVQDSDSQDAQRLRQSYYPDSDGASLLASPLQRDDSLLLTPQTTMRTILTLWQQQNWSRLYSYLYNSGAAGSAEQISQEDFIVRMENLPRLTDFTLSDGSVNCDATAVTFSVDLSFLNRAQQTALPIRLYRENCMWQIPADQLIGRWEE